jgi:transcription initiation factor TFIIIB Brf1 subunit/transcription initiation factor TFIIB
MSCEHKLVHEDIEKICERCGQVFKPDETSFFSLERGERAGGKIILDHQALNPNLNDLSRTTYHTEDKFYKRLKHVEHYTVHKRPRLEVQYKMTWIGNKMELPQQVIEFSWYIYKKAKKILYRRKFPNLQACACIYLAIRHFNLPKTINDILHALTLDSNVRHEKKWMMKFAREIEGEINIVVVHNPRLTEFLIHRLCTNLHLNVIDDCIKMYNIWKERFKFYAVSPQVFACAIIYLCCKAKGIVMPKRMLSYHANVCDVAITITQHKMREWSENSTRPT